MLLINYILILFFTFIFYILPYEILNYLIFGQKILKVSSIISTFICCGIIIYYFKIKRNFLIKFFVHEGLGIGFITLYVTIFGVLILLIFDLNHKITGKFCLVSSLVLILYSFFKGRLLKLKEISIYSQLVSNNFKFIFISDVHLGSNNHNHLDKILAKIKKLEFDFLIIGGDLIDSDSYDMKNLQSLNILKKPVFFVSGNHEYYLTKYKKKLDSLKKYNIRFLDNKSFKFENLNLVGISDNQKILKKIFFLNKLVEKNYFNLVIIHKPELFKSNYNNVDLMLCGHTHRGQIFPFNLLVKLKFKYIYGLYKKNNANLYVSSGVGCWGPKMRLGSDNEIVQFKIFKQ